MRGNKNTNPHIKKYIQHSHTVRDPTHTKYNPTHTVKNHIRTYKCRNIQGRKDTKIMGETRFTPKATIFALRQSFPALQTPLLVPYNQKLLKFWGIIMLVSEMPK